MTELIDRKKQIDWFSAYGLKYVEMRHVIKCIEQATTVYAVPITELLELRDSLYEMDMITMNGLKMLNELIEKYDGERK